MSPRKLSDADKSDILNLYRQLEETTSTLASRYGVSNSTISRILKSSLVESEYEALIQQKRSNRTPSHSFSPIVESIESTPIESETEPTFDVQSINQPIEVDPELSVSMATEQRWRRRRSSVKAEPITEEQAVQTELQLDTTPLVQKSHSDELDERFDELEPSETSSLEELLDEDLIDLDDEDDDLEDDDLEDDDDWDDAADTESQGPIRTTRAETGAKVQVLPLSEASLPKICYLVVDRAAELIARPLKEFGDLGRIPIEEVQEKTLPVFDNHRVARRFSNRSQRVIKVPDGRMLQKTCSHLQAKGITRLLIDGQVYSLLPAQPPS
jgi:transposase-like protein